LQLPRALLKTRLLLIELLLIELLLIELLLIELLLIELAISGCQRLQYFQGYSPALQEHYLSSPYTRNRLHSASHRPSKHSTTSDS
jgi:hypothetical protein